jgi:hypothetical protein
MSALHQYRPQILGFGICRDVPRSDVTDLRLRQRPRLVLSCVLECQGIEMQQIGMHSLLLGLMEKCYANEPRGIKRDQCGEMYRQHTWRKQ